MLLYTFPFRSGLSNQTHALAESKILCNFDVGMTRCLTLGLGLLMLQAQVLVWQETFDGPSAGQWVTESPPGSQNNPTPSGIPGLSYVTNQVGHNYFVINDANTPELDGSGNFVQGHRVECSPPNDLPNPYTSGGPVNRSLHITARASSDGAVLGYVNLPDYGDEYSWSNQGFGEDGNTDQWAYYNADISTVGRTCLRLTADFYLGGDRDRVRSYASILYSTDGGTTWQVLVPNIQATIATPVWLAYYFAAGTCNNWIRLTFPLPSSAENIPNLRLAFRWRNDNSFPMTTADYTLSAGFNVDNIRLEAAAPPTANFTASATTACKYETITFTNLTSIPCNLPTTYTWSITPGTFTFVGGTNASSPNPQIQFTQNGTYTVSLTATNAAGTHTYTATNYITITSCPPVAAFTMDRTSVCALNPTPPSGSLTQLTLTDVSDLRNQPFVSRTWSIIPASGVTISPSPSASPVTVTFANPGSYTIQLTVQTADGTDDTIRVGVVNVASCACGGTSSVVDSTVFYTQSFDACANSVFSANNQTSCGWQVQFFTNGTGLCPNHWRIDANEAGATPPGCGYAGGTDKSLYMGATGAFCSMFCSGACYDDGANTDKRIRLASNIDFTAGALYPYDSIVVQFDMIGYGGGDICGPPYTDYGNFEYSTDGGATWITPTDQPWVVNGGLQLWANAMNRLASNLCYDGQGQWTRLRWRLPLSAMTSIQFRIAFRWRNVDDGCGIDPSFAVDDIRIVGYKSLPSYTANYYIGPNGGSWHVAANWSLNNVPDTPSEDAEIPAGKYVVITQPVDVRHVCNFGRIEIRDALNPNNIHLTVRGNLLNEGQITTDNVNPGADVRLGGPDTRYRGSGTNVDADYAVISSPGQTTLEADLSCRSLRISGGFNMSGRTVTLYRDLSYTTGAITYAGSRVILNGPCLSCLDNGALQQISANLTLNLYDLIIDKPSGTVLQQAADVRINGTMTIKQGVYDVQTNQLRDGASGSAPLVMQGGELRMARLATTLPELSGAYTLTGGKVTLYGNGDQILRGNRTFWDLRFENTGVKTLGSGGNTLVQNQLELALTSGYVDAATNNVILWVQNPTLFAVTRSGGHVVGRLRRSIQGLGQYRFDVGRPNPNPDYERLDVLIRQPLGGVSHLTTQFIDVDPTDPSPAVLESGAQWQVALAPGYWEVNPNAPPTSGLYDVLSYPIGFTLPASPLQYTLGKRPNGNGADWSQTLTGTYVAPVGGLVRRNGFSAFSEFGILTSPTPLPAQQLELSLRSDPEGYPQLSWRLFGASEALSYHVLRSSALEAPWQVVGHTTATAWRDLSRPAFALYRVEAVLPSGQRLSSSTVEWQAASTSQGVLVQIEGDKVRFRLIGLEGPCTVQIWSALGAEVAHLAGEGEILWHVSPQLARGLYFFQVVGATGVWKGRFLW